MRCPAHIMDRSDSLTAFGFPTWRFGSAYLFSRSYQGLPSSQHFSPHMPRSSWTPADPPEPHQIGSFVLASSSLTLSPSALQCFHCYAFNEAISSLQGVRSPLWPAWFSVYASIILFDFYFPVSSITATLDMGGWLDLAR